MKVLLNIDSSKMKTTVPNNSQGKSGSNSACSGSNKIKNLEKELEEINKVLGSLQNGKKDSIQSQGKPTTELKLLEQKVLLMFKLKQWANVSEEGYKILGKKGPNVLIYKIVLISLCRLGKVDDVVELLDQWKRTSPKCTQMIETKSKMENYLTAIRSGVDIEALLNNIEDVIKINPVQESADISEPTWTYRPPPARHNTFSLCPRVNAGMACIYGNECLSAHSKEELKEWQQRVAFKNEKNVLGSPTSAVTAPVQVKSNIPKEQIPISYRALPPACMYYILALTKKMQETKNLKSLFVDGLQDVKLKLSAAATISKRLSSRPTPIYHKWSFMIASKRPMATVTLLHDSTRDRFAITGAFFFNSKRATLDLIELHPNNKSQKGIQVLNTFIRPDLFLPFNGGWPEWCCYQIDIVFQCFAPGKHEQDIIFDFKSDPKICKRLTVIVEPPMIESVQPFFQQPVPQLQVPPATTITTPTAVPAIRMTSPINNQQNITLERDFRDTVLLNVSKNPTDPNPPPIIKESHSSSRASTSHSTSVSDCEDNLEIDVTIKPSNLNNLVLSNSNFNGEKKTILQTSNNVQPQPPSTPRFEEVDSVAGLLVRQWVNGTEANYNQLVEDLEKEALSKENYISWMNRFILCEIKAREQELAKLSVKSDISIFNASTAGLNSGLNSVGIGLFGKLYLAKDLSQDSKIGRLIFSSCRTISIGQVEGSSTRTYVCRVINKTDHAIIILIGRKAVEELKLTPGSTRKLDILIHLDIAYLDLLKAVLQGITEHHLKLLFPSFPENQLWDLNSIANNSISRFEIDKSLNNKQRDAVQGILSDISGSKQSDSGLQVPILIIGPPGSGKSHVIARSIMSIFNSQKLTQFQSLNRILLCTYTNKAADEYITEHFQLWQNQTKGTLLRIYHADHMVLNINPAVKKHCLLVNDETSFRYPNLEELLSYRVIIVTVSTCLELLQIGLPDYIFSHVFLDECHRNLEVESLCPILLAGENSKIVIAGDTKLLDPETFTLPTLNSKCKEVTLIERLHKLYPPRHPFRIHLEETYNTSQDILQFISNEFYSSSLKCARSPTSHSKYYPLAFSIVHDGEDCQPDHGDGFYNMKEIYEVRDRINELIRAWPVSWGSPKDHAIAVITPYPDQALGLRIKLKLEGLSFVDVETLPNVLTKQYRVVLISPVRTFRGEKPDDSKVIRESDSGGGFFTNAKTIYTAMTRAKSLFIVVGDFNLCNFGACKGIWRQYIGICRQNNSVHGLPGPGIRDCSVFTNSTNNSTFDKSKVIAPPSRPKDINVHEPSSSSSVIKKPEMFSSNLEPAKSEPYLFQLANSSIADKPKQEPLKKIRTLSSIWNTDSPPNIKSAANDLNDYSGIWNNNNSQKAGSLGSLADPSSIWSVNNGTANSRKVFDATSTSQMELSNKLLENNASINSIDLPDVRLLAESALGTQDSSFGSQYQNKIIQRQALPTSNLSELLNLTDPFANNSQSSPTLSNSSDNSSLAWSQLNDSGNKIRNSHQQDNALLRNCTNFEIAQANYAYYHGHGPPRRLGYNVPPRMLRTFRPLGQINPCNTGILGIGTERNQREVGAKGFENFNIHPGFVKEAPKNFDFFSELGLNSDKQETKHLFLSSSSSTSSQDNEDNNCELDDNNITLDSASEFPDLNKSGNTNSSDWIEVKSTKKGKKDQGQQGQKKKNKKKSGTSTIPDENQVMTVDEMIESLKEMGFEKRLAIKALQACNKDLESSVEWLIQYASTKKE